MCKTVLTEGRSGCTSGFAAAFWTTAAADAYFRAEYFLDFKDNLPHTVCVLRVLWMLASVGLSVVDRHVGMEDVGQAHVVSAVSVDSVCCPK